MSSQRDMLCADSLGSPLLKCHLLLVITLVFAFVGATARPAVASESVKKVHALAMHGTPKYPPGFQHFDYVRPDAPKGGILRLAVIGTFDTLNPYIIQGVPAHDHRLIFESLLARSFDEPFSLYGAIAESVEMPTDRAWIIFNLAPTARFHDGTSITADDVLFSWQVLKSKGKPNMRIYYSKVTRAEKLNDKRVRFTFVEQDNWELPLILGLMPILSKAYYTNVAFDKSSLAPPVGSGPYRIVEVEPGRSITYRRDPDYWGAALPVNVGRHNFDTIRFDYYRDADIALEAFKAGEYDLRFERDAGRWATGYDHPAVKDGRIRREAIAHGRPVGMLAIVFNTRLPVFRDRRVRQALAYAFDFKWLNKVLYHNAYTRTTSYFENSNLAAKKPITPRELELLQPYRATLSEAIFTAVYRPPGSSGTESIRHNLKQAVALLAEAGWHIKHGKLVESKSGRLMEFEILLLKPRYERMLLPFTRNLERLGIKARIRTVDSAQYENRTAGFDFDVIVYHWGQSLSPGNEQEVYWSARAADTEGSRNYAGIKDPVVDDLIRQLAGARDRASLMLASRALDRVLLWGHYVIPLYHLQEDRVAYWNRLARPKVAPVYGTTVDLWWYKAERQRN